MAVASNNAPRHVLEGTTGRLGQLVASHGERRGLWVADTMPVAENNKDNANFFRTYQSTLASVSSTCPHFSRMAEPPHRLPRLTEKGLHMKDCGASRHCRSLLGRYQPMPRL